MVLLKIHLDSHRTKIVKVDHFPFSIGRSIDSSFILDHPSISIHHCFIDINAKGDLYIQDCHSKNGLYSNGDKIQDRVIVDNTNFYLGDMKMEVILAQSNYDQTREIHIPLEVFHGEGNWRKILFVPILSYFFVLIPEGIKIQLTDPLIEGEWGVFFFQLLSLLFGITLFSFILAFISKIHLKKYQLLRFIKEVNIWVGLINLNALLLPFALFSIESQKVQIYCKYTVTIILLFMCIYSLLRKIFHRLESWNVFNHSLTLVVLGVFCKFMVDLYDANGNSREFNSMIVRPWKNYVKEGSPERKLWMKLAESAQFVDKDRISKQKKRTQIGVGQFRSSPKGGG